jgi:hypothetical protein
MHCYTNRCATSPFYAERLMLLSCPCVRIYPFPSAKLILVKHYTIIPTDDLPLSCNMQTTPKKGYWLYLIWAFCHMAFHIYLVQVCTTGQDRTSHSTQFMSKKGIPPSCSTQIASKNGIPPLFSMNVKPQKALLYLYPGHTTVNPTFV